jgi:hypothetical protein
MFNGASGPLNGGGCACGEIVAIELAVRAIGDDAVSCAALATVCTSVLDVEFAARSAFGDCGFAAVIVGFTCGTDNVESAADVLCVAALLVPRFGDDAAGVVWTSSSSEDVLVVGAELSAAVCDSGVDTFPEDVASGFVDGLDEAGSFSASDDVDDVSAALVEADEEPESAGSAKATAGDVATAHPTPSATANAPTRPTYLT